MLLTSHQWSTAIVGEISKWIDPDAKDASSRQNAEAVLKEELLWASHLSVGAIVLPTPKIDSYNYANCINSHVVRNSNFWVRIPLWSSNSSEDSEVSSWHVWNKFRNLCGSSSGLKVLLELNASLPCAVSIDRWMSEPVRGVLIPTSIFLSNSKGYPVLSNAHQEVLIKFHKRNIQFIITGPPKHHEGSGVYYLYLNHLISRVPSPTEKDEFEAPYYDYLQTPLQPLGDHLQSQTYETFEKDPVKYAKYEEAIQSALVDTPVSKVSVIMVVGAGRGPLVRCALRAAENAKRTIRMFAVEKNPNAVITLRNMHQMLHWGDTVTIVHTDMRVWEAPELADILVSELLGSWGDNELSPECLDGAEKFLNPKGGISIPYEYTSFLAPISSTKLWNDCKALEDTKYLETMYVVKLHNFFEFSNPKPCFTFVHPSWNKKVNRETGQDEFAAGSKTENCKIDNTRIRSLEFEVKETGMFHGFAGYFEAKLYNDVTISINPSTFSTGMFSWFPLYIPIHNPFKVQKGELIRTVFWRHCKSTKVWYEWAIDAPSVSQIHNTNGKSQQINLSLD